MQRMQRTQRAQATALIELSGGRLELYVVFGYLRLRLSCVSSYESPVDLCPNNRAPSEGRSACHNTSHIPSRDTSWPLTDYNPSSVAR